MHKHTPTVLLALVAVALGSAARLQPTPAAAQAPYAALTAPLKSPQDANSPAAVYRASLPSVAELRGYAVRGRGKDDWSMKATAFVAVVSGRKVLVTCAHCLNDRTLAFEVTMPGGRVLKITSTSVSPVADLAVADAPGLDDCPALPLALSDPPIGTPCSLVGFPLKHDNPVFLATAVSQETTMPSESLGHDVAEIGVGQQIMSGYSGCPVLDGSGVVVGVGNMGEDMDGYHLSYAVPVSQALLVLPALVKRLK